jgi:hypothetical protein
MGSGVPHLRPQRLVSRHLDRQGFADGTAPYRPTATINAANTNVPPVNFCGTIRPLIADATTRTESVSVARWFSD